MNLIKLTRFTSREEGGASGIEIAKIETNKMIDKINYQQTVDAISKDWTEDMYEKVDAKKDKVVINLSNKHLETLTESDIPEEVGENFYCQNNNLKTLEGSPKKVGESFHCSHNALTSLESSPKRVGRSFYCFNNTLTSLEGSPKEVSGNFDCSHNALTSLEGSPKKVGGNFTCFSNKLTTLKGSPKEIGGNFSCSSNSVKFTEEQVRAVCEVKGKVYV